MAQKPKKAVIKKEKDEKPSKGKKVEQKHKKKVELVKLSGKKPAERKSDTVS